jgi:uncharacterized protein (TIGR02266 family)
MGERRCAHRLEVLVPARYQSSAGALDAWVENLSWNGAFLRSHYLDERGSTAELRLSLPGSHGQLTIEGEVVRTESTPGSRGMGIRFTGLKPDVRRQIANFLIERSHQSVL